MKASRDSAPMATGVELLLPFAAGPGAGVPGRGTPLALLLALATTLFLFAAHDLRDMPLVGDNQSQFYIAERVASGVPPHVSSLSAKHQLSFIISGLSLRAGRLLGADDVLAGRLASVAVFYLSAFLASLLAFRLSGSAEAAATAALVMLSFGRFPQLAVMGFRPKVFLVAFILLAFLALLGSRPFLGGLWASLAFLCWQPALIIAAGLAAAFSLPRPERGTLKALGAGFLLPLLIYEAYFVLQGAFWEQLHQSYVFPARYLSGGDRGLASSLASLAGLWKRHIGFLHASWLFLVAALAGLWAGAAGLPASPALRKDWKRHHTFFAVSMTGAAAFTVYDHQGFADTLFLLPFLALATSDGFERLGAAATLFTGKRGARSLVSLGGLALFAILSIPGAGKPQRVSLAEQRELAGRVAALAAEGGGVYAVGAPHLLALGGLANWAPYEAFFRGVRPYLLERFEGRIDEAWRKNGRLPAFVLYARWRIPELEEELRRSYAKVEEEAFSFQDVQLWRLARE